MKINIRATWSADYDQLIREFPSLIDLITKKDNLAFIEIDTMDQLRDLSKLIEDECGHLYPSGGLLVNFYDLKNSWIEIYDVYRE